MKTIILIQHCQSEHHIKKMIGGATDWNLTEYGQLQANNIGRKICNEFNGDWTIYSSDLRRAKQTAEIIAGYMSNGQGNIINCRKELREQDFGIATGKSSEWFNEHRIEMKPNTPMIYHRPIEGAETGKEVYSRVAKFMVEINESKDEQVIIVGHGGSCQMVAAVWLGISVEMLEKAALIGGAGGVSVLTERFDGAKVIKLWNNMSYRK